MSKRRKRKATGAKSPPEAGAPGVGGTRRKTSISVGKKLVFAVLAVAGFFIILELVLALVGVRPLAGDEDPYVGFDAYAPLFVEDDGSGELRTAANKREWFNDQRFQVPKPPGTFRIFALGGSTTYGRPYDHQVAFPKWMELLLDTMDAERSYEVINAGGISYASYRLVVLMRELVAYEPDLFVVYTGHNEFLEERTYRDLIDDGPVLRSLRRGAAHSRTASLLAKIVAPERERDELAAEVQAKLDVWSGLEAFTRDDALREAVFEHFRYNVRQLIAIARSNGVDIVFVEPASNVKDFSPFKSEHTIALGEERRERFASIYAEVRGVPAGEDCESVTPLLEQALELSPEFAELHFRLGRCRLAGGHHDEATTHLLDAKELDVAPLRALEPTIEILSEVTQEEDVALVPARASLRADSMKRFGHSLLGNEYFLDHVHPTVEIHQRIARWIVETIEPDAAGHLTDERIAPVFDRHLAALDSTYYARRDLNLGKVLGWAEKNAEAAAAFERALAVMPNEPELLRNLAIVYQKQNEYARAIDTYRTLERIRPNDPEIPFNLGKCWQAVGAWTDAVRAFQKAIEIAPNDAKAHYNLALSLRELERFHDELAALERAWTLDPEIPGIAALLGSVFAREGRYRDAIGAFLTALEKDPDAGIIHYHLASVYASQGQSEPALEHFRRARALGVDVPPVVFEELAGTR